MNKWHSDMNTWYKNQNAEGSRHKFNNKSVKYTQSLEKSKQVQNNIQRKLNSLKQKQLEQAEKKRKLDAQIRKFIPMIENNMLLRDDQKLRVRNELYKLNTSSNNINITQLNAIKKQILPGYDKIISILELINIPDDMKSDLITRLHIRTTDITFNDFLITLEKFYYDIINPYLDRIIPENNNKNNNKINSIYKKVKSLIEDPFTKIYSDSSNLTIIPKYNEIIDFRDEINELLIDRQIRQYSNTNNNNTIILLSDIIYSKYEKCTNSIAKQELARKLVSDLGFTSERLKTLYKKAKQTNKERDHIMYKKLYKKSKVASNATENSREGN